MRKNWELLISHDSDEILLRADNPNGDDMEVFLYRGHLSLEDYIPVPKVLPHIYRKFQDEFRLAHSPQARKEDMESA